MDEDNEKAGYDLLAWLIPNILPSEEFSDSWEGAQLASGEYDHHSHFEKHTK